MHRAKLREDPHVLSTGVLRPAIRMKSATSWLGKWQKKLNVERQALLKADTDKLLKLSTGPKEYVDKTNENVLSLDVLKKAEEIEKLAKSVKEKMRGPN